ncbi:MAG: aspartyl-phosphate phosphatase Spo0E family protein [Clostridiales bacterium]|nr:aspartyl-phosphate phosphatase Spo0E family protein [Clostridiales bacterium]
MRSEEFSYLEKKIEELRCHLNLSVSLQFSMNNETIKISQELDEYIAAFQKLNHVRGEE